MENHGRLSWSCINEVVASLVETYPEKDFSDVESLSFVSLKSLVLSLPNFEDGLDACNERVLEAIHYNWLEELE
jgi:FeS assembly protein IscX